MSAIINIKQEILKAISAILGEESPDQNDLNYPPQSEMGDLSLPLFKFSKALKSSPAEIGEKIMSQLAKNPKIESMQMAGPYLNFKFKKDYLIKQILTDISREKNSFGNSDSIKQKIVIEFSNVNTHKEYHIGHLRNICFGDSVSRIQKACGGDAIAVSYVNDFGIHVAKTLWDFESYTKNNTQEAKNKGYLLGKIYVNASKKEKDDPTATQMIGGIMREIESRKGSYYDLWKKTRQWSIDYFQSIYDELGVEFNDFFYENDYIDKGKKIVDELLKKGVLEKSEGAVIANLQQYDLSVLVLIRSNGTSTYPVADLALAQEKSKRYKPDVSAYVVDIRQSLYFKQLFKLLELSGHKENLKHLAYDFVKLPSGMMSSRTGNVITYDELKEAIVSRSMEETKKRHDDWSDEKIKKNAMVIGLGAIKFEMLKVSALSTITFDIEKALSFDGYTSAYIQYCYARIMSLFKKADEKPFIKNFNCEHLEHEVPLIMELGKWPETVMAAGKEYDPSKIAKHLYEICQKFNDYYQKVPIIMEDEKIRTSRLSLCGAAAQVIKNGLELLGIGIVEEM